MVDKLDSRAWLLDITQLPFCKTTKKNRVGQIGGSENKDLGE